jgi:hypothetical protein
MIQCLNHSWDMRFYLLQNMQTGSGPSQPPIQLVDGLFSLLWHVQGQLGLSLTIIINVIPHTATVIGGKKCCISYMLDRIVC